MEHGKKEWVQMRKMIGRAIAAALITVSATGLSSASTSWVPAAAAQSAAAGQPVHLSFRTSVDFPPGFGEIDNGAYGCLDAKSQGIGTDGDPVQLWQCNGTDNQLWAYNMSTGQIVNYADHKCLDAQVQSIGDGDKVQVWSCNGQIQQSWCFASWLSVVEGYNPCSPYSSYAIVNFDGDFCLDADGNAIGNGDKVELYSCNGGRNQSWALFPPP